MIFDTPRRVRFIPNTSLYLHGRVRNKTRTSLYLHGRVRNKTRTPLYLHGRVQNKTRTSLHIHGRVRNKTNASLQLHGRPRNKTNTSVAFFYWLVLLQVNAIKLKVGLAIANIYVFWNFYGFVILLPYACSCMLVQVISKSIFYACNVAIGLFGLYVL